MSDVMNFIGLLACTVLFYLNLKQVMETELWVGWVGIFFSILGAASFASAII